MSNGEKKLTLKRVKTILKNAQSVDQLCRWAIDEYENIVLKNDDMPLAADTKKEDELSVCVLRSIRANAKSKRVVRDLRAQAPELVFRAECHLELYRKISSVRKSDSQSARGAERTSEEAAKA